VCVTHVTTQISNLAQDAEPWEAEFVVGTGAIDCMAPRDRLAEAGIRPEGKRVYELANGEPIEYEYGFARVAFLDETVAQVVFGPPDTEPMVGVVALENTGVTVDRVSRTIRRMHAGPLK
jgi:hypothetical protein